MNETIESGKEEIHCARTEVLQQRDQQLFHEQLLAQNRDLREAHEKSLNEMEELNRFSRRNLVEDRDIILELTGKIQE